MAIREINLVPPEVLSRRYMVRHLGLWAGCLFLSMLLVIGFYIQQAGKRPPIEGDEAALDRVATTLGLRIGEIKERQAELNTIAREQTILDVVGRRQSYSRILQELSLVLNKQVWFRRLSAVPGPPGSDAVSLQITGLSASNDALGEFLNQLSFDPSFSDVVLKYSREGNIGGSTQDRGEPRRGIQFLIECNAVSGR